MRDIPVVSFSPESATAGECASWAVKHILSGELVECVLDNIPAAFLALSRTIDAGLRLIKQPPLISDTPDDILVRTAFAELQGEEGGYADTEAGINLLVMEVLIQVAMKMLERWMKK